MSNDTQRPLHISCPCISSVRLRGSPWARAVFVLASLLLFKRLTPVGQWEDWQTLRCGALCCHAPPQQVGKRKGFWWAQSDRPQGTGCLEGTSRPHKSAVHFTCKWSQKMSLCLWTEWFQKKKKKISEKSWRTPAVADMHGPKIHTEAHGWKKKGGY